MRENILIVGAGAAGLMAAYRLADIQAVTILESLDRAGGRINSIHSQRTGRITEAGPEFIHGHLPLTMQLLSQGKIDYTPVEGRMYHCTNGNYEEQTEMIEGWDELLDKMNQEAEDITLLEFFNRHFSSGKYSELRRQATRFAEGFDVADIDKISIKSLFKEWSHQQDENFRIPAGYQCLVEYLEDECRKRSVQIKYNQTVADVKWQRSRVRVTTADGQSYEAGKLIITVPIDILQQSVGERAINFHPALILHHEAARYIGMGPVVKMILQFSERFWKDDAAFIFGEGDIATWWSNLPDQTPVLTGWAGGAAAKKLIQFSDDELLQKGLDSLSRTTARHQHELRSLLVESSVFNWRDGAYTYSMPGSETAKAFLRAPVDQTIFFAGEGVYSGQSTGTVEAALVSGGEVAGKILGIS